jgi:hypothetical protein
MTRLPDCGFHAGILPKALGERVKRNTLTRIIELVKSEHSSQEGVALCPVGAGAYTEFSLRSRCRLGSIALG